jgi:hypothetical protein
MSAKGTVEAANGCRAVVSTGTWQRELPAALAGVSSAAAGGERVGGGILGPHRRGAAGVAVFFHAPRIRTFLGNPLCRGVDVLCTKQLESRITLFAELEFMNDAFMTSSSEHMELCRK